MSKVSKQLFVLSLVWSLSLLVAWCNQVNTPSDDALGDTTEKNSPDDTNAKGADIVVDVTGRNFSFSTTSITVSEGDTVTINFQSEEGFHDRVVDEFDAKTDKVNPWTPTRVTFVADKAGSYEYYCSVGQHRANGMVGTLIVTAK